MKKKGNSQRTRIHNPTFPLAITNPMATKKKPAKKSPAKSGGSRRKNPTPAVTNPKKKTHKPRRNPAVAAVSNPSVKGAIALLTTAVSVGVLNTGINVVTAFLPIPASGWMRTLSKFGLAYAASLLLPRTKVVSQQTADVVAVTIAAAAVMEVVAPYFSGIVERFLTPAPVAAVATEDMGGLVEWAGVPAISAGDSDELSGVVDIDENSALAMAMAANEWA